MSKKLPVVAIVGRANVGKSSLFNRALQRQEAIVAREAGTTRDSVYRTVEFNDHHFWLVDTAGLKDAEDEFEATIQEQIEEAADAADVIVVVVEAQTVITDEDRRVAKKALKSKKPVILVTNKADQVAKNESDTPWERLGIKTIVSTSATQSQGIHELLSAITKQIPAKEALVEDNVLRIALLGRPNVGKSQLFNTLAKKQQAVVADVAGTTRDVNRVKVRYEGQDIELLDTAGIRRSGKIERGIEKFSVLRSLQAIEQSDVCLLLMDVQEHSTALDQKIAGLIKEAGKGLIIVISKWDTLDALAEAAENEPEEEEMDQDKLTKADKRRMSKSQSYGKEVAIKNAYTRDGIAARITNNFQFVPWAQLLFTSAITGQNVAKIFDLALAINVRRKRTIKTSELNKILASSLSAHPPAGLKGRHPKPRYFVQDDTSPPTFRLYGAHLEYLHWSWKRYLEKNLRKTVDFSGTPVKFYMLNNERISGKTTKFLPKTDEQE
ncbi:ribosome biogenesis GTPase Der [Candidatus Saccharibacteria bacterium]|nr:ribosome biogenesis GTPase Der [Candidatus Saccharibacteria bacterium]